MNLLNAHWQPAALLAIFGSTCVTLSQSWTLASAPVTNKWTSIASSADGSRLVACWGEVADEGSIYVSTNSGQTWTAPTETPTNNWTSVAASADGNRFLAAYQANGGGLWSSSDGGSWAQVTTVPGTNAWRSIACSADGKKWGAADGGGNHWYGRVFVSTNEGGVWKDMYTQDQWLSSIASTADGTKWFLAPSGGFLFTSQDSGQTWIPTGSAGQIFTSIAASADGSLLIRTAGAVFTSTNSGVTWTMANTPAGAWMDAACSADGTRIVVVGQNLPIYISSDRGLTWQPADAPVKDWRAVTSSADGRKLAAVAFHSFQVPGGIYTWQTAPSPRLQATVSVQGLKLSWIVPSANMVLQQTGSLASPNWIDVDVTPTLNHTTLSYEVTIPNPTGSLFFRLALNEG